MQEWVIAMLVISVLLILRDMAKIILSGKKKENLLMPPEEEHPQKERVKGYAASFGKLADAFYGMPYKKEFLSSGQVELVIGGAYEKVCCHCYQRELCWENQKETVQKSARQLVRSLEQGEEEKSEAKTDWIGICGHSSQYLEAVREGFSMERQNLLWNNRMIESRLAVAQQMSEVSRILGKVAEDLYDITPADPELMEKLKRQLRKHHVIVKDAWVMDKVEGKRQFFLTVRAKTGQCISAGEIAGVLSAICQTAMTMEDRSRCMLNGEFHTFHFVEEVSYQMLYGVSRLTREQEHVSGDNFLCRQEEDGRFIMCLSDGMGSGVEACRESEAVVELLEQFLETGFSQETAARMVNSSLVIRGRSGIFSTVDLCAVDLYTGICSFLKAGAAATFIKRDHWVEAIASESLAVGLMQQAEFDTATRKLYHGDYLIMMTDGVLDALPNGREEETMKEIIMDVQEESPTEISRGILERVLGYSDYCARDDMTVLAAGMWKK